MSDEDPKPQRSAYGERQIWKVVIEAPIETVWNTLVKTDAVLPFFFGAVCDAGPGGLGEGRPMRMVSKDRKNAIVVGKVLEFSPPHRYSHTIYFTQVEGEQPGLTIYELKEVPGGTEFTLISEALPGTQVGKMIQGGPFIVENLKRLVETGKPAFSGSMVMALSPLMGLMTPKISRIGNWPLDVAAWRLKAVEGA
jgi:uncharacterized protein YndB with AHSA1/START domain